MIDWKKERREEKMSERERVRLINWPDNAVCRLQPVIDKVERIRVRPLWQQLKKSQTVAAAAAAAAFCSSSLYAGWPSVLSRNGGVCWKWQLRCPRRGQRQRRLQMVTVLFGKVLFSLARNDIKANQDNYEREERRRKDCSSRSRTTTN